MHTLAAGYAVASAASVLLLVLAWRRPRAGRIAFATLFVGAAAFNAVAALRGPEAYVQGFAPHAIPPVRELIERVLALVPDAFVLAIAAAQLAVGIGLAVARGVAFVLAVAGAASFLVGISWLGAGAAFPTNLVLATGVLLLLRAAR